MRVTLVVVTTSSSAMTTSPKPSLTSCSPTAEPVPPKPATPAVRVPSSCCISGPNARTCRSNAAGGGAVGDVLIEAEKLPADEALLAVGLGVPDDEHSGGLGLLVRDGREVAGDGVVDGERHAAHATSWRSDRRIQVSQASRSSMP